MAEVDLGALEKKMAATIEKKKQEDPKLLRAENAKLKSDLHKAQSAPPPKPAPPEVVEVPVFPAKLEESIKGWFNRLREDIQKDANALLKHVDFAERHIREWAETELEGQGPEFRRRKVERSSAPPVAKIASGAEHVASAADRHAAANGEVKLNRKAERMVMSALIQYPEGLTVRKLATITGYAKGGGGFRGALSKLRTAGYIEGRDHLVATDAGRAALPDVEPMPTGQALLDHWLGQMKRRAEREVLIAICEAWPNTITPEEVAAKTGYEVGGGGFRGALSKLRTLDLIEGRGDLRASDDLFTTTPGSR
jgi:hypothetical protein